MTLDDEAFDRLLDQSIDFADTLTAIVNGTVAIGARFIPRLLEDQDLVWIYPRGSRPGNVTLIPIVAGLADDEAPRLFLRTFFVGRLDDTDQWLTIHQSVLALVVDAGGKPRPVVRLEYDREEGSDPDDERPTRRHTRSAAHVQIHGTSAELAYARAVRNQPIVGLEHLHIPVGGRRYRPTLEDFVEFLQMHDLIDCHPGWRNVVQEHRRDYLRVQLKAAVRRDPATAIEQRRDLGYEVSPPM